MIKAILIDPLRRTIKEILWEGGFPYCSDFENYIDKQEEGRLDECEIAGNKIGMYQILNQIDAAHVGWKIRTDKRIFGKTFLLGKNDNTMRGIDTFFESGMRLTLEDVCVNIDWITYDVYFSVASVEFANFSQIKNNFD